MYLHRRACCFSFGARASAATVAAAAAGLVCSGLAAGPADGSITETSEAFLACCISKLAVSRGGGMVGPLHKTQQQVGCSSQGRDDR